MIQKQNSIMKRSNLFLALTTGALAVASFAFAKAHKTGLKHTGYCKNGSNVCNVHTINRQWTTVPGSLAKATCNISGVHHTAFTKSSCAGHTLYTVVD